MVFLSHAGASVSTTLISEQVGCIVDLLENLEKLKTLLKIQGVCAVLLHSIPQRLALLNSTHCGTKVGDFLIFLGLDNSYFNRNNKKKALI